MDDLLILSDIRFLREGLAAVLARDSAFDIGLATVKSHVHNVLGKLALQRRSQVARCMRVHEPAFAGRWEAALPPEERS
jgi:hypothetical protein